MATYYIARNVISAPPLGNLSSNDKLAIEYINKMIFLRDEIRDDFLFDYSEEELWISATKGLVKGTNDRYSEYITKAEYELYNSQSADFEGIGIRIFDDTGQKMVIKVFADSPASRAGMLIGDVLVGVDGLDITNLTTTEVTTMIRGEKGSSVQVTALRQGSIMVFECVRDVIGRSFVESEKLTSTIGYIHLLEFGKDSGKEFVAALEKLEYEGVKGIIFDLRQNSGGNVSDAVLISDELLGDTEIMHTVDKAGEKKFTYSHSPVNEIPIVVLVDELTASASEIVAGTLQDNGRAKIVGTQTYGKGIIQYIKPLADGSMYKLTYMEYFLPSNKKIHGEGTTPDYIVEQDPQFANLPVEAIPHSQDLQLQKALEVLSAQIGLAPIAWMES